LRTAGASPEPSALQAENAKLITALAACRDAFPVPDAGSRLDDWYCSAMADPLEVPEYVKACVGASPVEPAQQQPTSQDVKAALLFALWHHQGGSSKIGQPIRAALGIGQYANLTPEQLEAAKRVQSALVVHGNLSDKEIRKWWSSENGLEDMDLCKIDDFTTTVRAIEKFINAWGAVS
jgi:hypothetical protein